MAKRAIVGGCSCGEAITCQNYKEKLDIEAEIWSGAKGLCLNCGRHVEFIKQTGHFYQAGTVICLDWDDNMPENPIPRTWEIRVFKRVSSI